MTLKSPHVVFWLWHWLRCSVGPLQRCYRPAGTCNRYCCPPDPWWVLKFYSPRSWSRWPCLASASRPSTAAKTTQHNNTDYISSTVSFFCFYFFLLKAVGLKPFRESCQRCFMNEWITIWIITQKGHCVVHSLLALSTLCVQYLHNCASCVGMFWADLIA